jgi:hypothetical protein
MSTDPNDFDNDLAEVDEAADTPPTLRDRIDRFIGSLADD